MSQKWEGDCGVWVLNEIVLKNMLNHFIKNPQTTIALPFLAHNISATGGVNGPLPLSSAGPASSSKPDKYALNTVQTQYILVVLCGQPI